MAKPARRALWILIIGHCPMGDDVPAFLDAQMGDRAVASTASDSRQSGGVKGILSFAAITQL